MEGGTLRVENRREHDLVSGKQITILEMKPYELNNKRKCGPVVVSDPSFKKGAYPIHNSAQYP